MFGVITERAAAFGLEGRHCFVIGFEIDLPIQDQSEHQAVIKQPGTAEHALDLKRAEFRKQITDKFGIHGYDPVPLYCAPAASSLNGVSCTDSPQPQAEVWFGLLNTNWAESFSVL